MPTFPAPRRAAARLRPAAGIVALLTLLGVLPAAAQVQFRDLDILHPVPVEDAFPVARYAFEFLAPWDYARPSGAEGRNQLDLDLTYGAFLNGDVGLRLPLGMGPGGETGLVGAGLFSLYNPLREGPSTPALSLRGDLFAPSGAAVRGGLTALATRSFGAARLHANAGAAAGEGASEELPRWEVGVALDYTFFRPSLLLVGALSTSAPGAGEPTATTIDAGVRWQWTPTLVVEAGAGRRLSPTGPDLRLTLGLSSTFGIRRLVPVGPPSGPEVVRSRAEQFYYPGSFNWTFLAQYAEAARLFNAFDYGHAVLYERLTTAPQGDPAWLEVRQFDYLTRDLLIHPPRLPISEEALFPEYATRYWPAALAFDWAHLFHRQVYDALADTRRSAAGRDSLVEQLTDYYLSRRGVAFAPVPKAMSLMMDQPYSGTFERAYPKLNGLIWAYHWLQVGLYEPLTVEESGDARHRGVDSAVARFRAMIPGDFPDAMPMTPMVAPTFAARHPRAAAVFDNLHSLHDIISDILLSDVVPPETKRAAIEAALAEFRDGTRNVMPDAEWRGSAAPPALHH
jgi:hypothetical protein